MDKLKVHPANSSFKERFAALPDVKQFALRCYPGLKVGEVELSRNEGGKNGG